MPPSNIIELPELRDTTRVFHDRADAGQRLAVMLGEYRHTNMLVLGIPAYRLPREIVDDEIAVLREHLASVK